MPRDCPACGHGVGAGEFCEACSYWMTPGTCRFCYARCGEDVTFCQECGSDQAGLLCSRCKTRHFFDFCSTCGEGLSPAAVGIQALQQADPAIQRLRQELMAIAAGDDAALESVHDALPSHAPATALAPVRRKLISSGALDALRSQDQASTQVQAENARRQAEQARLERDLAAAAKAAARQDSVNRVMEAQKQSAFGERSLSMSARLRASRERVKALAAEEGRRTFADAQEARRHAMALCHLFSQEGRSPTGWLCNYASCTHPTPNECAGPQFGGSWVFTAPETESPS